MTHTPAKRGDLVAVIRKRTVHQVADLLRSHTTVELGRVTSVTREGIVKRYEAPFTATCMLVQHVDRLPAGARILVGSQASVDADGALKAYAEQTYPNSDQVEPFATPDDAKAFLKAWKR